MMDIVESDYDLSCVSREDRSVAIQIIRAVVTLERQMPKLELNAVFRDPLYSFAFKNLNKHLRTVELYRVFHSDERPMEFDNIVDTYTNPVTGSFTVRWRTSAPMRNDPEDLPIMRDEDSLIRRRRRKRRRNRD